MSWYFFDLHDGLDVYDDIGRELDDDEAARAEALKLATRALSANSQKGRETGIVLTVRGGLGVPIFKIRLICQIETL